MNKKIAIPMENGVLSEHFGHCQYFSIFTVEDNKIIDVKEVTPPEHAPGVYPKFVAQFGTTDVIGGGMGPQAVNLFIAQGINVFVGAPVKSANELVKDFLENKLNLSANYCDHDKNGHHDCNHNN
jgi:predicted Fe-Mo cluster-binding NifX family protein